MIELTRPWLLALVAVVGIAPAVSARIRRRRPGLRVTLQDADPVRAPRWKRALSGLPPLMRGGAVTALTLFVAGPVRVVPAPGDATRGVGVMIALDVSESMGDVGSDGATRLEDAEREIRRFLEGRDGDRVGLVTFGGEALVRVPPSNDRRVLDAALDLVRVGEEGDGTAIGTAVGFAAVRLRALDARSRVIILVTDGRSNAGVIDPLTAARAAAALGQRVYVVDVGGPDGGGALLANVARVGGGRRWAASDRRGAEAALREIGVLEPSAFPGPPRRVAVAAAAWLLWLAGALLLGERWLLAAGLGRMP
jgi:Ca-activated chloride channel family protein